MKTPRSAATGEERLIARHFRPLATHPGALGLIDDAAVLSVPAASELVLTVDAVVAGVHFFPGDPPDLVAKKALRVNLSDLAAKGATPAGFLLSLALPQSVDDRWLKAFTRGLRADAKAYGCPLLGGDTDRTAGPITISIAAFGTLPKGAMVHRSGARTGDRIVVTGTVGDAALGLALRRAGNARPWRLRPRERAHLSARYLLPQPRNAIAECIRKYATAAMDVSDGLAGDLGKLCAASGVAAIVDVARVPLSPAARRAVAAEPRLIEMALTGGDDYEILAAVPPRAVAALRSKAKAKGVPVTEIGTVVRGKPAARFRDREGKQMLFKRLSFSHF
jgi:thiamine-monophosphate kinase